MLSTHNYSYELRKPFQTKKKFKRKKTGTITVNLKEGKNLKACDSNGKSDPYVILTVADQTFKSKAIKANINPTWNETFIFTVLDSSKTIFLRIKVYDQDILGRDDEMGEVKINLTEEVKGEGEVSKWYPVILNNEQYGEIRLKISAKDF